MMTNGSILILSTYIEITNNNKGSYDNYHMRYLSIDYITEVYFDLDRDSSMNMTKTFL
jgi:hypothetical protein